MGPTFACTAFLGCVWWVHTHVHVIAWAHSCLHAPPATLARRLTTAVRVLPGLPSNGRRANILAPLVVYDVFF